MKVLKKIIVGLFVLAAVYLIACFFLPSQIHVARSTFIHSRSSIVFNEVNNFQNWPHWSYWDNIDPEMKSTYEGPKSGIGAIHKWTSNNKDVGTGSIKIVDSKPDSLILTDLAFGEMPVSHGGWHIKDTTDGVVVTTYMDVELSFAARVMPGLLMEKFLGPDFEKTLAGLKKQAELLEMTTPHNSPYGIEATVFHEQILASVRKTTSLPNISNDIASSYKTITDFLKKNNLGIAGYLCAFYHNFSPDKIEMECAIPINKMVASEGDVHVSVMKAGKAVVANYFGPYTGTSKAHQAINTWINENHKKIIGSPWEEYITDPMMEKDTSKWLTKVYYPIE